MTLICTGLACPADPGAALIVILAIAGGAWGFASDRIAARWPAHAEGAVRHADWRTFVVTAAGGAAGALLAVESAGLPALQLIVLAVVVLALVLLFATDLDQRLLPDLITLPLIPLALVAFALGANPFFHDPTDLAFAVGAAVLIPALLYLVSIPFGAGAIGLGDLKLLVGIGLLGGAGRLFLGLVTGAILAAVVILALVVARRITLKTYVPYGPFLIAGILWALLGVGHG